MTYTKAVAMRTTKLLLQMNISKYELRKRTGLSEATLRAIMNEKTEDIKMSTVDIIARGLGMTLQEFCNDELFGESVGGGK